MSLKIIQGEDRVVSVSLKDDNGGAFDLTGYTATAEFCQADGNQLQIAGVLESAVGGKLSFTLTAANTLTFDTGTQGFTVTLTKTLDSTLRKVNLNNSIIVEEAIC